MILNWKTVMASLSKCKMDGGLWSPVMTLNCPLPSGNIYIQNSPSEKHLIKDPVCKFKPDWKGTSESIRMKHLRQGVCWTCMPPRVRMRIRCSAKVGATGVLVNDFFFCKKSWHSLADWGLKDNPMYKLIWDRFFCVCLFLGNNFTKFLDTSLNNF